jgi:predicted nucleic acid-binding protein
LGNRYLRIEHFQELEVHDLYLYVLNPLSSKQAPRDPINAVEVNMAVKVQAPNESLSVYVIVENAKMTEETPVSSFIARALIGKKVGETVEISKGIYTIVEILNKYVWALQDSTEQMRKRFDNQGMFKAFDNAQTNIADEIRQQLLNRRITEQEQKPILDELISQGAAPMSMLANNAGVDILYYWNALTDKHSPSVKLFLDQREISQAFAILGTESPIALDITSLMAFQKIGLLDVVAQTDKVFLVAYSTLELLKREIYQLSLRINENDTSVGVVGNELVTFVRSPEQKQKSLIEFTAIETWINERALVVDPPLHTRFETVKTYDMVLGKNANDTLRITMDRQALLLSDDRAFRLHAGASGIKGSNTLIFLQYLQQIGMIGQDQLEAHFMSLLRINYVHVPVTSQMLLNLCIEASYTVAFPFKGACEIIHPSFRNNEDACKLVVDFLYLLYQQQLLPASKTFIIQFIILQLFAGRKKAQMTILFATILNIRFHLMPLQKRFIIFCCPTRISSGGLSDCLR